MLDTEQGYTYEGGTVLAILEVDGTEGENKVGSTVNVDCATLYGVGKGRIAAASEACMEIVSTSGASSSCIKDTLVEEDIGDHVGSVL